MINVDLEQLRSKEFTFKKPSFEMGAEEFEKLRLQNKVLTIDARSPDEFEKFHILNSINFSLLNNEQRKIIGTMFKDKNRDSAIAKAWELVGSELNNQLQEINSFLKKKLKDKQLIVYCSRGGLRSGILTNLIELIGYKPIRLIGGLKSYKHILTKFLDDLIDNYSGKFIICEGLTGTRKTELLKKSNLPFLDLENCAQHKASVFGDVGLNPNSQKMFITNLYNEFLKLKNEKIIFLEGEANRIGDVYIPLQLWNLMKSAKRITITASVDTRVKATIKDYCDSQDKINQIIERLNRLTNYIAKNKKQELINQFQNKDYYEAIKWLLTEYYDKKYCFADNKNNISISTDDLNQAIKKLKEIYEIQ